MPQHTATWKQAEKKTASILGDAERICGPRGVEMEDVHHPYFSVEVKHGKSVPVFAEKALAQAATNAPAGKVPVVVLHRHCSHEYVAVLSLRDLARLSRLALAAIAAGLEVEGCLMPTP